MLRLGSLLLKVVLAATGQVHMSDPPSAPALILSQHACNLQGPDCSAIEQEQKLFHLCINNCTVGVCTAGGFCRCPPGHWGIDCSRSKVQLNVLLILSQKSMS